MRLNEDYIHYIGALLWVLVMMLPVACAEHRKPKLQPNWKWKCTVLAHDAKTLKPSLMLCDGDTWTKGAASTGTTAHGAATSALSPCAVSAGKE